MRGVQFRGKIGTDNGVVLRRKLVILANLSAYIDFLKAYSASTRRQLNVFDEAPRMHRSSLVAVDSKRQMVHIFRLTRIRILRSGGFRGDFSGSQSSRVFNGKNPK